MAYGTKEEAIAVWERFIRIDPFIVFQYTNGGWNCCSPSSEMGLSLQDSGLCLVGSHKEKVLELELWRMPEEHDEEVPELCPSASIN